MFKPMWFFYRFNAAQWRATVAAICLAMTGILAPSRATAEEFGYYIAPQQVRAVFQMAYSADAPERNYPVKTPPARFLNGYGGFRFDADAMKMVGLRLALATGSIVSPDRSFTWKLLGPDMFDVNTYEEAVIESVEPVQFVNGEASFTAQLQIHKLTKPIALNAKLLYIKDNSMGLGLIGKNKFVAISLRGSILCRDYSMQAADEIGRSMGDNIAFLFEFQGIHQ